MNREQPAPRDWLVVREECAPMNAHKVVGESAAQAIKKNMYDSGTPTFFVLEHEKVSERLSKKTMFDGGEPFDDRCVRKKERIERKNRKKVYTYNIYGIHHQSIENFLKATQNEIKITRSIKVSPTAWEAFKYRVAKADPFSSMSDRINDFLIQYVIHAVEDRHQPKITQFFINKPNVVNIADKVTAVAIKSEPLPNFDEMTDEELQTRYERAMTQHRHGRAQTLSFLIKKRRGLHNAR